MSIDDYVADFFANNPDWDRNRQAFENAIRPYVDPAQKKSWREIKRSVTRWLKRRAQKAWHEFANWFRHHAEEMPERTKQQMVDRAVAIGVTVAAAVVYVIPIDAGIKQWVVNGLLGLAAFLWKGCRPEWRYDRRSQIYLASSNS